MVAGIHAHLIFLLNAGRGANAEFFHTTHQQSPFDLSHQCIARFLIASFYLRLGCSVYIMKLITANFLACAVKGCKTSPASFPLHFRDVELELQECDFQPEFIRNILPRIDWGALQTMASEVSICLLCYKPTFTHTLQS